MLGQGDEPFQVSQPPGQAIQPPDPHGIARLQLLQELLEGRTALARGCGQIVVGQPFIHLGAGGLDGLALPGDGQLITCTVKRLSEISVLHEPILSDGHSTCLVEPGKVFVARAGINELTTTILTEQEVRDLVERMLKESGRRVDLSTPFVDAMLPDGSRLHVVIPDITRSSWAVNIRKFLIRADALDDLVTLGTLTPQAAHFLAASVVAGLNILVSGGTQAGKTTLLSCLLSAVPARQRIITVEETFELQPAHRDVVAMQCRPASLEGTGEIPLRRLIKEALRMRPDRLIVGEVRQAESLDMLLALNSGLPGMGTVHANSAREALLKMCTLPLLAGENVSPRFILPTVAMSIDLVVHIQLDPDGRRRISEIVGVPGRIEADVIETGDLFVRRGDRLIRTDGFPPYLARFERAGIDVQSLLHGGW